MAGVTKVLEFSEGVTTSGPTTTFLQTTQFATYADEATFVSNKGSAAENGDAFYDSTLHVQKNYINGAWQIQYDDSDSNIALLTGAQTFSGAKTFSSAVNISDTTQSTDKDTGALIVEGGVGIEKNLNVGGNIDTSGSMTLNAGSTVSSILDEDNMVSDSNTAIATQQSIKAYVDANIPGASIILDTNHIHESADFPSTTDLYAWNINGSGSFDGSAWVGAKTLTENGTIATTTDVLGNTTYCDFDGLTYLSSSDAVFDAMTTDFSISLWAKADDWNPGVQGTFISKTDNVNGWALGIVTTGEVFIYNYTAGQVGVNSFTTQLASGWHHITLVRDSGTSSTLYIDGVLVGHKSTAAAITDAGNLEIGGRNGGTSFPFNGAIQDVAVNTTTAWTPDQVRKIFSASSGKYITLNQIDNTKVQFSDRSPVFCANYISSSYTVTGSFAIVTGYSILVPEDGKYKIRCNPHTYVYDSTGTNQDILMKLWDGTDELYLSPSYSYMAGNANGEQLSVSMFLESINYLVAGSTISLYAKATYGTTCQIISSVNHRPYISLEKID